MSSTPDAPGPCLRRAEVAAEVARWLAHLGAERRMSAKTCEAYERDVRQFLAFLAEHLGGRVTLAKLTRLAPADVRAFMAARRADGIGGRSLMRGLAGVRSFARFLERNGQGRVGALAAVRAPKVAKGLPKPLPIAAAKRLTDADLRAGEDREPWVLARDAAVLALLYGSGLRISEALGLKRKDVPAPGARRRHHGHRQGQQAAHGAGAAAGAHARRRLCRALPLRPAGRRARLFIGASGGPLSPRIVQLAMARLRGALGLPETATPHALRHSFATHPAGARRRPARDPGTARPRLAVDDADLYRRRCRAAARSLPQRPPAGVTNKCRLGGIAIILQPPCAACSVRSIVIHGSCMRERQWPAHTRTWNTRSMPNMRHTRTRRSPC